MPKIPKNMNRLSIKKFIQKSRTGIIVIVIAAALAQVLNIGQYIYTRYAVKKHAMQQAYDDQKEIQRVLGIKTRVETAVENAMGDVLVNLQEPDKFYGIVSRMVSRNPDIVASTIAMRPEKGRQSAHDETFGLRLHSAGLVQRVVQQRHSPLE